MTNNVVNGVNVDQLVQTVNLIKDKPDIAKFTFRAKNEWINGGHSKTTIGGFYGAGQEDSSRKEGKKTKKKRKKKKKKKIPKKKNRRSCGSPPKNPRRFWTSLKIRYLFL